MSAYRSLAGETCSRRATRGLAAFSGFLPGPGGDEVAMGGDSPGPGSPARAPARGPVLQAGLDPIGRPAGDQALDQVQPEVDP